jgi:hypothetical protein
MLFDQAPQNYKVIPKLLKLQQANDVNDDITLILMLFVIKANLPRLSKSVTPQNFKFWNVIKIHSF